jgi:uncharacterized UBP type Zn finger protein
MSETQEGCSHLEAAAHRDTGVTPSAHGCAECISMGASWVHLRLCLTCGHVGCCDSSPNKHASKHYKNERHPVARSYEPGERWAYCFADDEFIEELPAFAGELAAVHYDARRR